MLLSWSLYDDATRNDALVLLQVMRVVRRSWGPADVSCPGGSIPRLAAARVSVVLF